VTIFTKFLISTGGVRMKCRVCGKDIKKGNICPECKEEIEILSNKFTSYKRKINLDFDEHRFCSRKDLVG